MSILNKSKFNIDLIWNLGSFGFIALAGLLVNFLIIYFKGYDELGLFNQVYAIYIVLSQICVFGIHLAVQAFIPKDQNENVQNLILSNSIFIVILVNILLISIFYLISINIKQFPLGKDVQNSLLFVFPALLFFSINKVILQFLNGKQLMKSFAIFNSLRYLCMLLLIFVLLKLSYNSILVFLIGEFLLTFFLFVYVFKFFVFEIHKNLIKKILSFGKNVFWGNLFLDINSRIDVIILGVFLSNELVGVYSFVVIFYEGMLQILIVVRNNVNPIITKLYFNKSKAQLKRFINTTKKLTYKRYSILAILMLIIFPLFLLVIQENKYFWEMNILFGILMLSNILSAGYQPFFNYFNQIGQAKNQSVFYVVLFLSNLLINFILIPFFSIYGAAIGILFSNLIIILILHKYINYVKS